MKVLVTGATGFIGRHLCKTLDSLDEYKLIRACRKKEPQLCEGVEVGDINQKTDWSYALSGVDVVIHAAARVHIMNDSNAEPLTAYRNTNTYGTVNLAEQASRLGVKRFIFISSIKVNGEKTIIGKPFTPVDMPNPSDPYGISKNEAEQKLRSLGKVSGMEIVIIRPPLVYGEGVKANFATLLNVVSKGLPLPFRAIKNNRRSLVSVYNLIDLIRVCVEHPRAANETFLVSDDNDLSTADMIALMAKVLRKKNIALPVPVWFFKLAGKVLGKQAFVDRLIDSLQLDISHTKQALDWKPPHSVEYGFKLVMKSEKKSDTYL